MHLHHGYVVFLEIPAVFGLRMKQTHKLLIDLL